MLLHAQNRHAVVGYLLATALLVGFAGDRVSAQDPTLAEMNHTMWTAREGAPQGIRALAQSPDGILWIGTEGGLFTFDGRSFNAFQPLPGEPDLPAGAVYSVFTAHDGTVWVGFYEGGIARILHGHVTVFTRADEQQLRFVTTILQSADGSIWALSLQKRVVRFGKDGSWHVESLPAGPSSVYEIFIDSTDTLWLAQGGRLYRRPLTQSTYSKTDAEADWIFGFAEAADRSIWVTDVMTDVDRGRTQHVDRLGRLLTRLPDAEEAYSLLYAPDGSLIMISQFHGLRRFARDALIDQPQGAARLGPETYTHLDGLSSDAERTLLLDSDGNIWAGGHRGLDRFRKARLTPFVAKDPQGEWQVCANKKGDIWISSNTGQLYRVSAGITKSFPNVGDIYLLFCADDGDTWFADHVGIWQMHADRMTAIPPVPGANPYALHGLVASPDHRLFVLSEPRQLWQYKNNQWTELPHVGTPDRPFLTGYMDSQDRLWTGYRDGLLGLPLEGRSLSSGKPGLGGVYAILETSHGLLAAGLNGLAVLRKAGFEMLTFTDHAASRGVAGLAESQNGDLWLNASRGILRVPAAELQASLANPGYPMKSERVTEGEFVGPVRLWSGDSTAARDAQGNLWFATLNGVLHVNPGGRISESHLPRLSIRSIATDQRPLDTHGIIGPRPQTLNVQYFGVNLTAPEKVIYRYRLDGLDDAWQNAGHRTEAIYTHLRPGTYTFRVAASNGDDVWTTPVSSMPFTVLPSFYQTVWFRSLCVVAGIVLLWFIFMARIRAISRAIRARAEERADERIRISRELHDTLLQGIQGLLLSFHVASEKLAADDASKKMLEKALSTADRIIIEGRNRVNSLRSEHLTDAELMASLDNVCRDLKIDDKVQYRVNRSGIDATLHSHVADEIFSIAREALTNAFRHSGASHIRLELAYGNRYFSMSCADDGRGFDAQEQEKSGHWGLKGIFERAQKLGGQLRCRSEPLHGTEILFVIPSYRAYKGHSRVAFYLRAHRYSERSPVNR